jgi:hypothetical protein
LLRSVGTVHYTVNGTQVQLSCFCIECVITHVDSQNHPGTRALASFCGTSRPTLIQKSDM